MSAFSAAMSIYSHAHAMKIETRTMKMQSLPIDIIFPSMKNQIIPLNQNIVVRRAKKPTTEEIIGGIVIPQDTSPATITELVEIVAISEDLVVPNGKKLTAKPGDKALIHRGLNMTPVKSNGEDLFMVGYTNLIAIVA